MSEAERFLSSRPPFDALSPEDLGTVAGSVQVEFFPTEAVVLQQAGSPADHLYIVRTGSVEFLDEGRIVDVSEEGEVFGHPSLLSGAGPTTTVRAAEDTLCYLIPREVAERVLGSPSGLAFLASSLRRWLERRSRAREAATADPRLVQVDSLVQGTVLECPPESSVRSAAELMTRERRPAVLVRAGDGRFGILTDADLRAKVVAEGLPPDEPVRGVMTFPAPSLGGDRSVHEALMEMLDAGVDHLVVLDDAGRPRGLLSDTDVLGLERRRPFVLRSRIERAGSPEEVAALGRELPSSMVTLVRSGLDAVDIGRVVALIVDALTRRLIHLAHEDLGPAPVPYAWLALGSEARREQALSTDQDHALAYVDGEDHDTYFAALASRVVEGLERCGIPRCRAGVSADEGAWRRPVSEWRTAFDGFMRTRGMEPVTLTTIAFDFRVIAGQLMAEADLDEVVRSAGDRPAFLRRLAMAALDFQPPVALRGKPVPGRRPVIDLKHGGVMPIVDLARLFALEGGSAAKGTLDRLRAAETAGRIRGEVRSVLEEAFRVILDARLELQAGQVQAGQRVDNLVDPASLGRLARTRLKEAFRAVAEVQRTVARHYHFSRLA